MEMPPLDQFKSLLRHQRNFLEWIDTRHNELIRAKQKLNPKGRGPKDAVYRKYRWYAGQQSLLEAINAFELFYKNTFIGLSKAIQSYVSAERIKGTIDAKVLWTASGSTSPMSLIFEHQLFHNLTTVDDVTNMLVGARRYMPNNSNSPLKDRVKALQAVFQMRHTLSHNQGRITHSDRAKLVAIGYSAQESEVLDPSKDHLGVVVRDLLITESGEFTDWLLARTAEYLEQRRQETNCSLLAGDRTAIEKLVGIHASISQLPWQR